MSLHQEVGLLSLKIWPEQFTKMTLEVSGGNIDKLLGELEYKWTRLYPEIPFNYYFVDDNFREQYTKDQHFAAIMSSFTVIAICIGILGLIAYATFWCERRRKEMSIRKVLGAGSAMLIWNLYKGFSAPVLLGFILAIPISAYLGGQWLEEFAYRLEIHWHFLPYRCCSFYCWSG